MATYHLPQPSENLLLTPTANRTCVYRYTQRADGMFVGTNVNNEIGLPGHADYCLWQYFEDQRQYEGREVVYARHDVFFYSNGDAEVLAERTEPISEPDWLEALLD